MMRLSLLILLGILTMKVSYPAIAEEPQAQSTQTSAVNWLTSYPEAMQQAKQQGKLMLVLFEGSGRAKSREQFDARVRSDKSLGEKLNQFVLVRAPTNATISVSGKSITLLSHGAFAELKNAPGIAILDFANRGTNHYGHVVSALRFTPGKYYTFRPEHLNVLVDLPPGTLTQRTMIFAVRIHPERPASAWGEKDQVLSEEAASHSSHQARIGVQGHHQWDSRFQRILGRLFGRRHRAAPVEVVAESWPNQDLVDSCVDCVDSWRQSPGHWSAVQGRQAGYGYDIRRGNNGIWYATGIFTR